MSIGGLFVFVFYIGHSYTIDNNKLTLICYYEPKWLCRFKQLRNRYRKIGNPQSSLCDNKKPVIFDIIHNLGELDRKYGVKYPRDDVIAVKTTDGEYVLWCNPDCIFLSRENTLEQMKRYGWWPQDI